MGLTEYKPRSAKTGNKQIDQAVNDLQKALRDAYREITRLQSVLLKQTKILNESSTISDDDRSEIDKIIKG